MAQEDYVISDQSGVSFLSDLNDTLAAIVSNNSGATEPATMYAYMFWADTTGGVLKQRNAANNAWVTIGALASPNLGAALVLGSAFTGPISTFKSNTALSDAAATLTAAQLIGGEFTITPTVARIQTVDTAANIISALTGSVTGSSFEFTIVNLDAFDVTIATATGVTLVGNMMVNNGSATFSVRRLTSSTVSITRIDGDISKVIITPVVAATTQDWDGVSYTDSDAVGASPSAKIYPDGTVVGSTVNGNYVKYPNGVLHCEHNYTGAITSTAQAGGLYVGAAPAKTFPVAFTETPRVVTDAYYSAGDSQPWATQSAIASTTQCTPRLNSANNNSIGVIIYKASGVWK